MSSKRLADKIAPSHATGRRGSSRVYAIECAAQMTIGLCRDNDGSCRPGQLFIVLVGATSALSLDRPMLVLGLGGRGRFSHDHESLGWFLLLEMHWRFHLMVADGLSQLVSRAGPER
jgi:hypothetical protein